ncbi:amidase [Kineococcus rhizosphaerae]|uniref:Amidase n=1 Tax=Kineococcus rhizosphaerae TaxID=559628 RepID=A0A2T0QMG1_9ACTN|nr:amidase [Kineococcus rhizosphaerae]PRY05679.1 amidase [Kineococcus rhizosphaerae]
MTIQDPTLEDLRPIADRHFAAMDDDELSVMQEIISSTLDAHRLLDGMDDSAPTDVANRDAGRPASPEENPHRGWVWRCDLTADALTSSHLAGKTVAIKDNVAVAGLPMKVGTRLLEGFIPDEDATIVTRVLAAGGNITGKAACEHMSFSGSSFTADTGAILNPHNLNRSAGGSSSGSAALVAAGDVDIASGGDQSGSIRIPASFCGVYGFKPSYGLVSATGAAPIEVTVDHLGALASTVSDIARFMDAVAGEDPMDPRQLSGWSGRSRPESFLGSLTGDVRGLRVGIIDEGFAWDHSEQDVDDAVVEAAAHFTQLGATVERMSLPMHRIGMHINTAIQMEGAYTTMLRGNLAGSGWKGRYPRRLMEAIGAAKHTRSDEMSDMMKELVLIGEYLTDRYHGSYYAKAQNLALQLTTAYDAAFQQYDVLITPSTPVKATEIPDKDVPRLERFGRLLNMVNNTSPTCVTGNPSISVPCATSSGLPVGMMITGRRGDDTTVLRVADAFERTGIYGPVQVNRRQHASV